MFRKPPPDETVELATFGNWNEAEIAKSFLEDEGVNCYIIGQDPHRGPEFSEGLKLRVLASKSEEALDALHEADLLPSKVIADVSRIIFYMIAITFIVDILALVVYS
jgi:hypothetical protein